MTEWRTIDSLPEDRTPVLLLREDGVIGFGHAWLLRHGKKTGQVAWMDKFHFNGEPFLWQQGGAVVRATHWIPLAEVVPALPKSEP